MVPPEIVRKINRQRDRQRIEVIYTYLYWFNTTCDQCVVYPLKVPKMAQYRDEKLAVMQRTPPRWQKDNQIDIDQTLIRHASDPIYRSGSAATEPKSRHDTCKTILYAMKGRINGYTAIPVEYKVRVGKVRIYVSFHLSLECSVKHFSRLAKKK